MLAPNAEANHPGGLMVCDSGGKDSDVIKELARLAGVRFEIAHSHTTADHPLTVRYVREEQARWRALGVSYTIIYPTFKGKSTSMWALIPIKGAPMRQRRWCCDLLKETAGAGRYTVTGVRWAESANRKQRRATYELPSGKRERIKLNNDNDLKRRMTEFCMKRGKVVVNPIIDWQDADVWEFHDLYHLPHNPLYDLGYKRVGCIGCPIETVETRTYTDEDGDEHEYDWYILTTKLTTRDFEEVVRPRLETAEHGDLYDVYMDSLGGHQKYGNPLGFEWLGSVTSLYGYRENPTAAGTQIHRGLDIAAPAGTPIYSVQDGTVIQAVHGHASYGNYILIADDKGRETRYAHCSVLTAAEGQKVKTGDKIAEVGSTGNSTGNHLHIEIKENGQYLNPLYLLNYAYKEDSE